MLFAQIATRIGGALTATLALIALTHLGGAQVSVAANPLPRDAAVDLPQGHSEGLTP